MSERDFLQEVGQAGFSAEQFINLLEKRINDLESCIGERPAQDDPLSGDKYNQWKMRAAIMLGRAAERLQVYREMKVLPPEQSQRLKLRALAVIARAMTEVAAGVQL